MVSNCSIHKFEISHTGGQELDPESVRIKTIEGNITSHLDL